MGKTQDKRTYVDKISGMFVREAARVVYISQSLISTR